MLKYQLDSLDGVEESVKGLYTKKGDKFVLGIEGLPDVSEYEDRVSKMDAKINELLSEKKDAKRKADEAAEAARQAAADAARKAGDVEAIEKSWQEKLAAREKELQTEVDKRDGWLRDLTVQASASRLAGELAVPGSSEALLPHIERRLSMEVRDGKPTAIVLDEAGKPSAMTVEELGKHISGKEAFAPLIRASNASGGGANGANGRGGAAGQKTVTRSQFDKMSHLERATFSKDGGKVVHD